MLDFASVFPDLSSLTPTHVRSAFTYSCLLPHPHNPNGSWGSCSWKSAMTFSHAKQWAHFIFLNKYFIEIQRNKRNLIHEIYVCLNDSQHNLFQLNIYFNIFLGLKTSAHSSVSLCIISPPTDMETLGIALFFPKVEVFPFQLSLKGEPEPCMHCSDTARRALPVSLYSLLPLTLLSASNHILKAHPAQILLSVTKSKETLCRTRQGGKETHWALQYGKKEAGIAVKSSGFQFQWHHFRPFPTHIMSKYIVSGESNEMMDVFYKL